MESIGILVNCQCGQENFLKIAKGDRKQPRCYKCSGVLVDYAVPNGYIYVLSNPSMAGLLKIGLSTRSVDERVAELSAATGVPTPFELEAFFVTTTPEDHEQQIHEALAKHRVTGREFFKVSLQDALQVAQSICKRLPTYLHPHLQPIATEANADYIGFKKDYTSEGNYRSDDKGGWDFGPGTTRSGR